MGEKKQWVITEGNGNNKNDKNADSRGILSPQSNFEASATGWNKKEPQPPKLLHNWRKRVGAQNPGQGVEWEKQIS